MSDLITRIQEANDFASLGSASDEQISDAEKSLQLTFAEDFKEYLRAFGVATFCEKELTGISSSDRLNVVAVTTRARNFYKAFPADAYVIEELLFDHIITIQKSDGTIYSYGPNDSEKQIASSLFEYLFPKG